MSTTSSQWFAALAAQAAVVAAGQPPFDCVALPRPLSARCAAGFASLAEKALDEQGAP